MWGRREGYSTGKYSFVDPIHTSVGGGVYFTLLTGRVELLICIDSHRGKAVGIRGATACLKGGVGPRRAQKFRERFAAARPDSGPCPNVQGVSSHG